jgi:hypothetical protein
VSLCVFQPLSAIEDSYKRLLKSSNFNEALQEAEADANSIQVLPII